MNFEQQVIQAIMENLSEREGGTDLEFFTDPSRFPVGASLGTTKEHWSLGFVWSSGLYWTTEPLDLCWFEYDYDTCFKGTFELPEKKVKILGDCDPPRDLNNEELSFIKGELPKNCRITIFAVYRKSLEKSTKTGTVIQADCVACYYARNIKKGLNTLQLLATK